MSYSLKISSSNKLIDASTYIVDIDQVPFIERNEDYTLVVSNYNFVLSPNYPSMSLLTLGDNILVFTGSKLINNGYVINKTQRYPTLEYDVEVNHIFGKMNDIVITSESFSQSLVSKQFTENINNLDRKVVDAKGIVEACFKSIGCTVDFTASYTPESYGYIWTGEYDSLDNLYHYQEVLTSSAEHDLYFMPAQLFSLGQDYAETVVSIKADDAKKAQQTSAFNLLSIVNSFMGWMYVPATTSSFYVINNRTTHSISDSYKVDYNIENITKQNGIYVLQSTLKLQADNYNGLTVFWYPWGADQIFYEEEPTSQSYQYFNYPSYQGREYGITYYNNINPFILRQDDSFDTWNPYLIFHFAESGSQGILKYYYDAYVNNKIKYTITSNLGSLINSYKCVNKILVDVINDEYIVEQTVNN